MSGARHTALGLGAMAARNGTAAGRQPYGPRAGFADTERRSNDEGWRDRAACRDVDPELHFPIGNTGPALRQIEDAKDVCRGCSAITDCLSFAINAGIDHGVWGGLSEDERRALKRRESRQRQRESS